MNTQSQTADGYSAKVTLGLWLRHTCRYGTAPGYDQDGIGADGFQEIFTASTGRGCQNKQSKRTPCALACA